MECAIKSWCSYKSQTECFLLNCENCRHSTTQQINHKINIYSVRLKAVTIEIKVDNEVECTKKQNKLNEYTYIVGVNYQEKLCKMLGKD